MENVDKYLAELADACWQFSKKMAENPFIGYSALDMEETPDLEQDLESWYYSLIGMIRWMVDIGIVDIIT